MLLYAVRFALVLSLSSASGLNAASACAQKQQVRQIAQVSWAENSFHRSYKQCAALMLSMCT
jgi:ABC-type proline/glycine betaine transport system substrate-binding protein